MMQMTEELLEGIKRSPEYKRVMQSVMKNEPVVTANRPTQEMITYLTANEYELVGVGNYGDSTGSSYDLIFRLSL